jgi:DNA-directed RNA polymerase specialized sigma24 family protein
VLDSPEQVITCLLMFTDWWQPTTTSILQVGGARRKTEFSDGFRSGLLDSLAVRTELCSRVAQLADRDRRLLFLWYVVQLLPEDIGEALGISRRQCFRRRASAIRKIVELGETEAA